MAVPPADVCQAIINKKHLYCRLVDTDQFEALLKTVFIPEATLSFRSEGKIMNVGGVEYSWSSAAEFAKYFEGNLKGKQVIHHIAPPQLEQVSADEVKAVFGISYAAAPKGALTTEGHYSGGGYYHETWVRRNGEWFLKEMNMDNTYARLG